MLHSRISEKSELGLTGAFYYRLASDQLERVSDHASKIADIIMESGEKIPNAVMSLGLIADSVKRIGDYAANVAELAIDFSKSI